MLVDPNIADAYYSRIKSATKHPGGAQYWGFPCETTLADLKLQMGNGTAVVRGKYMSAGLLGGDRVRGLSPREFTLFGFAAFLFFRRFVSDWGWDWMREFDLFFYSIYSFF